MIPGQVARRSTSLKQNVAANYVGQAWRALIGLAFIPLYIKYLGIEAYGLIGVFALLQAWLALLDMGMKPALAREMARFTAGAHDSQSIRDLLRTVEIIAIAIAALVSLSIWAASGWLASDWLMAKNLPVNVVAQAFAVMGVVTALGFIESLYVSCAVGLQRQVLQNLLSGIMATVRAVGAIAILAWLSPSIEAFFLWQGLMSLVTVTFFAGAVYRALPRCPRRARFSWPALREIWRFAAGMMTITLLALLLTQVDKILLSRLLTLDEFGWYALASLIANVLYYVGGPISTAFNPSFTELATRANVKALSQVYHQAAQLITVLMGSAAIVLVVFGARVLMLWTGDSTLTSRVTPLITGLAVVVLLDGLNWIPYQVQLAHGWTSLAVRFNATAVVVFVPVAFFVVPRYGPIAVVCVRAMLQAVILVISVTCMFRRLLIGEKWRWCIQDVAAPLAAGAIVACLCRWVAPVALSRWGDIFLLLMSFACVVAAAGIAAPAVRKQILQRLPGQERCAIAAFRKPEPRNHNGTRRRIEQESWGRR